MSRAAAALLLALLSTAAPAARADAASGAGDPDGTAAAPAGAAAEPAPPSGPPGGQDEDLPAGPPRLPRHLRSPIFSPPMSDLEEPASEEEAAERLRELLPHLEAASLRHERYALRFTCDESLRRVGYSWQSGEANSERTEKYAYLLVFDEDRSRYRVLRETIDRQGRPSGTEARIEAPVPDAYAWTFLFSPRNRRVLHYTYVGREIKDFRLTHVIDFDSAAPFIEGQDMREWSGTVWIEDGTYNFVRVEAVPSFQDRRLLGQWRAYAESFNVPWGKLGTRPRGYEVAVEFNYTRDDLLFPTRVDLREFVWLARGRAVTDRRFVFAYTDYRFFQTSAEPVGEPTPGPPPS